MSTIDSAPAAGIRDAVAVWRCLLHLRTACKNVHLPMAIKIIRFTARLTMHEHILLWLWQQAVAVAMTEAVATGIDNGNM